MHFSFFGGEPLIKKNKMFDLAEFSKKLDSFNLDCSITTNGSLLEENDIKKLINYNCKYLQITLDGSEEQHNNSRTFKNGKPSFSLLIEKIKLAAKLTQNIDDFKVILRFNLLNNTLDDVSKTLDLIDDDLRKKIHVMFRAVFNTDCFTEQNSNTNSNIDDFNAMAVEKGFTVFQNKRFFSYCEACGDIHTLHILPDLTLWKCISDLDFDKACIGKLNNDGTISWNTSNVINWFKYCDFTEDSECKKCSLLPDCLGGCAMFKCKNKMKRCDEFHELTDAYRYAK